MIKNKINNSQELSPSIPKNTSEVALVTWKPSREDSSPKSLRRKNSNWTLPTTRSISGTRTATKKNKNNHKKPNPPLSNPPPNNHKHQNNNKNQRRRKTIWLSLNKPWKSSAWLRPLMATRRKRRRNPLKKPARNPLLPNNNPQANWNPPNSQ